MNTEEINFRHTATAHGHCYRARFAGCTLLLSEDQARLQVIDKNSDHETWTLENGCWIFDEGSNGQAPTAGWPETYFKFVEDAIAGLTEKD